MRLVRKVRSYVYIEAENEEEAQKMCTGGIGIEEDGNLNGLKEYEGRILEFGTDVEGDVLDKETYSEPIRKCPRGQITRF